MNIIEKSNDFLRILALLVYEDIGKQISIIDVKKSLGINNSNLQSVLNYLLEKKRINQGSSGSINLTAQGLEKVYSLKENKEYRILKFLFIEQLPIVRDGDDLMFHYQIYNGSKLIADKNKIKVGISGVLQAVWNHQLKGQFFEEKNFVNILFQYGKDKVIEKLKEGTLNKIEEVELLSTTHPKCLYDDLDSLIEPTDTILEVDIGQKKLTQQIEENKLAALIIEVRDVINAKFYEIYKERLLTINEERNLLDFFKSANTEEEFSHRISSLGNISKNINSKILKKIINEYEPEDKSLHLLDKFFKENNIDSMDIIKIIRNIGIIRNGYPNHTDSVGIKAYDYFSENYPIVNYNASWKNLLQHYYKALKQLEKIISNILEKKI